MGFNSGFKGLIQSTLPLTTVCSRMVVDSRAGFIPVWKLKLVPRWNKWNKELGDYVEI